MNCIICHKTLTGLQKKYCSGKCKAKSHTGNCYANQQNRGKKRKLELINQMGGGCSNCGYNKNHAALDFHHIDESAKTFQLDIRSLSNRTMSKIKDEANKCILLCANCHREHHHPECEVDSVGFEPTINEL